MARSQNGFSANDRSVIASYELPGGRIALRKGDVSVILLFALNWWHNRVEPLVWPGIWGYAERLIRGSSTDLSNHASGTAADANAPQHPLGTAPTANFSAGEIAAIRALIAFCTTRAGKQVLRWGGDYFGRKDGMHLEINDGVTTADLKEIADKIRALNGGPSGIPAGQVNLPRPAPSGGDTWHIIGMGDVSTKGTAGEQVRQDQANLIDTGFPVGRAGADGFFGDESVEAAKAFQWAAGLARDGAVGPATRAALRKVPSWRNQGALEFQRRLKERGWNITVDGKWGPKSAAILKAFQQEKGLAADGQPGPQSWTALYTRGL